jgi:phasin family protein
MLRAPKSSLNRFSIHQLHQEYTMTTVNEQFSDLNKSTVDTAVKFARVSVDSAEQLFALNMAATESSLDDAAKNMLAMATVKDVQELNALRAKLAESSLEHAMGYSRTVYQLATNAQAMYSSLVEERVASFQDSLVDGLDKVAKSAPAGSDIAVAAMKSNLAAATAAMDSFTKAAKQVASYADAGVKAAQDFGVQAAAKAAPKAAYKAPAKRK